ncbi:hypothetical protein QBC39DRAFT_332947 [Podospora conica]|nr:hypothetical protein QBC39DRAFT_332947 [Schizothecium conicum]
MAKTPCAPWPPALPCPFSKLPNHAKGLDTRCAGPLPTVIRIAKQCQYERKYRKPHTIVSDQEFAQFEFFDDHPIPQASPLHSPTLVTRPIGSPDSITRAAYPGTPAKWERSNGRRGWSHTTPVTHTVPRQQARSVPAVNLNGGWPEEVWKECVRRGSGRLRGLFRIKPGVPSVWEAED